MASIAGSTISSTDRNTPRTNDIPYRKADIMPQSLMQGFPPAPEAQVTLANWLTPPFNRWSFQHVR